MQEPNTKPEVVGWTLKWHSRREKWMLQHWGGNRWGFDTREEAERFAAARGIEFTVVREPGNRGVRVPSEKTLRRRARTAPEHAGG